MSTIGIIEDDPVFAREVERCLVSSTISFRHWTDAESFLQQLDDGADFPDLLLLDLNLPGIGGISLLERLEARYPGFARQLPVVVLSSMGSEEIIFEALRRGATGYILKSEIGDITIHVNTALEGGGIMSPTIAVRVINNLRNTDAQKTQRREWRAKASEESRENEDLTARETEVLELLVCGLSAREAAAALCISPHTVRVHIKHIYQKLYVANKVELLREARNRGYI